MCFRVAFPFDEILWTDSFRQKIGLTFSDVGLCALTNTFLVTSAKEVMFSPVSCLSVCYQDYSKNTDQIL